DYVLMGYGTGAIMAVPAHDTRDFEFAKKYNLPIKFVIKPIKEKLDEEKPYIGPGEIINSGKDWEDYFVPDAIPRMIDDLEKKGIGKRKIQYHLRDWLISRQRYWGPPIPMINCPKCGWQAVPEADLPVLLPDVKDWKPLGAGKSPLATIEDFVNTTCPKCGGEANRETDVSDTFLDSAWYFFRYISTDDKKSAINKQRVEKWLPVNMYIGGAEHSVLHLLYSRFITMFFKDQGLISFEEPYAKFRAHGLLIKEGAKMSKSKGNVVIPDAYIKKFGADTLRMYLMFLGPFIQGGDFYDTGIEGMHRFVKRVWTLSTQISNLKSQISNEGLKMMHKTIKKVTEDLEELRYNTAIASIMEYYNFLVKEQTISKEEIKTLILLISPLAPHVSEELWEIIGEENSVHKANWPKFEEEYLVEQTSNIILQINGKVRDVFEVNFSDINDKQLVEDTARQSKKAEKYMINNPIQQVIYVPGKVINFVVKDGSESIS
ncbi:MAG: class I tRNA ligase family protein, partial [Patescibacteria group bacterium]